MSCEVENSGGVLHVRGEMTIYGAAGLKDSFFAALKDVGRPCTVDLEGVSELDTTGIQMLLMAQRECLARGTTLTLANPSGPVREAFELLHIRTFPIHPANGVGA